MQSTVFPFTEQKGPDCTASTVARRLAQVFILLLPMVRWLHKLLFIAISFSFFISATEMDLGECHNTFFDEYDTYVKTEQVSLDQSAVEQQVHDTYAFIHCAFSYYQSSGQQEPVLSYQPGDYADPSPPKLFLRNSVWRI